MSTGAPPLPAREQVMRRSPYQGLVPYAEADADWFFGRDDWREIIADNLRAYRISVLYGPSGVGKSSLLNAGVVRRLNEESRLNLAEEGRAELVVVAFSEWSEADPAAALKEAVRRTLEQFMPPDEEPAPAGPLADVLGVWSDRLGGSLLVILDQLEEYFFYHPHDQGPGSFQEQLSEALRRRDVAANFLLSIREDAVAQLDRFEGRVPGLLDNLLRLEHLDRDAGREAIERPLEQWNRLAGEDDGGATIEPGLVEAVLAQVTAGKVSLGRVGRGSAQATDGDQRIEAPYLQLVLDRLWSEERRARSRTLRLATLERLGGAEQIVRSHLDATMDAVPPAQQEIAARAFRYLVTPSGNKVAYRVQDLADYSGVTPQRLEPVLDRLGRDVRILRAVDSQTYEIFHDALAAPVLDWRNRWHEHQRRRRERRRAVLFAAFLASSLLALAALGVLAVKRQRDNETRQAIREATHVTQLAGDQIIAPSIGPGLLHGNPASIRRMDRVVHTSILGPVQSALGGSIVRVKIWRPDGTIVYSDEHALIGQRYEIDDEEMEALEEGKAQSEVSNLSKPENRYERSEHKLLEVYQGVQTNQGQKMLFEAYRRFSSVEADTGRLWANFAPALIATMLLLAVAQGVLAWLLSRSPRPG